MGVRDAIILEKPSVRRTSTRPTTAFKICQLSGRSPELSEAFGIPGGAKHRHKREREEREEETIEPDASQRRSLAPIPKKDDIESTLL